MGDSVFHAADSVDTRAVAGKLAGFKKAHGAYVTADAGVKKAGEALQKQQAKAAEADVIQDESLDDLAVALPADGLPRVNPFKPFGAPSLTALQGLGYADEARKVLDLEKAVLKRKGISKASIAAAKAAGKAALRVQAELDRTMINKLHIENFKCLRDVTVDLKPLTVLIGKNDTGKTSFLEALGVLIGLASGEPTPILHDNTLENVICRGSETRRIALDATIVPSSRAAVPGAARYRLTLGLDGTATQIEDEQLSVEGTDTRITRSADGSSATLRADAHDDLVSGNPLDGGVGRVVVLSHMATLKKVPLARTLVNALTGAPPYRFNPRRLTDPGVFSPSRANPSALPRPSSNGEGLSAVLDYPLPRVHRRRPTLSGYEHKVRDAIVEARISGCTAVVVVVDRDGSAVGLRLTALSAGRTQADGEGEALAKKTALGVAVETVEAWLLADETALNTALDPHPHAAMTPSPELLAGAARSEKHPKGAASSAAQSKPQGGTVPL